MTQFSFSSLKWSRIALTVLVMSPIVAMGILTVRVLMTAIKNPESNAYGSKVGYPSLQRMAGNPIQVETVAATLKSLEQGLAAPGESVALQEVEVRSQITGQIMKVHVVEGQRVRRGQPLLEIEKEPFANSVRTAQNNIAISKSSLQAMAASASEQIASLEENIASLKERISLSEAKLRQTAPLVKEGAISQFQMYDTQDIDLSRKRDLAVTERDLVKTRNDFARQIDTLRLNIRNNQLALQDAQRDLRNTVIYSNVDGLVSKINVHSGEVADERLRDSLVSLAQDVVFKAYIDQASLNALKLGDYAVVRLIAYPGQTYKAKVIQINPTVETAASRPGNVGANRQYTYSVWLKVLGLDMPPGLQGYAQIEQTKAKTSLVIPESAVTHLSAGEGMVMVMQNGNAVVRKVKLGQFVDNQREVLAGLKAGEKVVLSPRELNPGDKLAG
jgi:HlyD family secretion protein